MLKYKNNEYLFVASCVVLLLIFGLDVRSAEAFFGSLIVCAVLILAAIYATKKQQP